MLRDRNENPVSNNKRENVQNIPIPELYANAAMANISPYEFEITLGLGSSNYEGVRPVVNLRMSPQFARELTKILVDNVKLYEEKFGSVNFKAPVRSFLCKGCIKRPIADTDKAHSVSWAHTEFDALS